MARRRLSTRAAHPEKVDYQTGPSKAFSDFETSYYDLAFVSSGATKKTLERKLNSWRERNRIGVENKMDALFRRTGGFSRERREIHASGFNSSSERRKKKKRKKTNRDVQSIVAADGDFKTKRYSRWAADKERERFALFLNANRGGTRA